MIVNALGIDVEEWFHLCGVDEALIKYKPSFFESRILGSTTKLLEILKEYNVRATFFVLGIIAENSPGLIKKIIEGGHEIASHSYKHVPIYQQTREEFSQDLKKSIDILHKISGKRILGFRAPDFSITKKTLWAIEVLRNEGIKYDCSIFPIFHPRYGIPHAKTSTYEIDGLIEFPPSTIKILWNNFPIAGGAYLRILPYSFIKGSIKRLNAQNIPVNIYLHPWEIDSGFPSLQIPLIRKIPHYAGIKTTLPKLRALLSDFKFSPISEVLQIE